MSVPVTGAIILAVAVWFFFFSPRLLYVALIVSIPFSATAVVNFGWSGVTSGATEKSLMAWQLFAILWVARGALSDCPPWHKLGWFLTRRARLALLVFLATLVASWSVPIILNGTSWVPSWVTWVMGMGRAGPKMIAVRFTSYNLTQTAYVFFGVLFAIFIAAENWRPTRLLHTVRIYLKSCLFVAAWGLFQLGCIATGSAYPAKIFNTSENLTAVLGDKQSLIAGSFTLGRISSVALEPSMLAEGLLLAFVILIVSLGIRRFILPRTWNWPAVLFFGTALVFTTSTTAYAGILVALVLAGVAVARSGSHRWRYYPAVAIACVAVGAFIATEIPLVQELVRTAVLQKYVSGTGAERLQSVAVAAGDFLRYPILGVGWHEVDCYDLVFLLLANVGVVGLAAFASFLLPILKKLWRLISLGNLPATLMLPSLGLTLVLIEGAGLSLIATNWLVLGLAAGAAAGPMTGALPTGTSR